MSVAVGLVETDLTVSAGGTVGCTVRVRNTAAVVDQFTLDVVGDAASWAEVEPATMNLLPGTEQEARVTFTPPRAATVPAGSVDFGVRVRGREDPEGSVVEEGTVTVLPFVELATELVPRTSQARRAARHQLVIDNTGNVETTVEVLPADPDRLLTFRVLPAAPVLRPGTATFVKLRVRPRKRFLLGPDRNLPFQVAVTRPDAEPITSDGLLVQRSVLPAWSPRVVLVAAAAAVALVGLWFAVLKPTVQSTAKEAAQVETKELSQEVAEVKTQASEAAQTAEKAEKVASVAAGASPKPSASPSPTAGSANGKGPGSQGGTLDNADPETAADFRVATSASPTTSNEFTLSTYKPADKKVLWVTDIVLQNPHGDAGLLQVRRGDTVLLETGLNNFRDLDYHFVQPLRFSAGQPVTVAVKCANPGTTACTPAAYFAGQLVPVAPAPSPSPSR
ncbi:hypothetical protein [Micromonospora sp. WMMD714]|uniref:COG1470 family protein n=1 Tax=Micromonospora sp. WMMD714 TaxID=3016097 RepID=UPI00249A2454|nr:hypothetical protein [Micromonospora sp. WMMD714]WFE63776.1 hypothetical protein O7625_10980 [Micromonospora sp. WMMD714]